LISGKRIVIASDGQHFLPIGFGFRVGGSEDLLLIDIVIDILTGYMSWREEFLKSVQCSIQFLGSKTSSILIIELPLFQFLSHPRFFDNLIGPSSVEIVLDFFGGGKSQVFEVDLFNPFSSGWPGWVPEPWSFLFLFPFLPLLLFRAFEICYRLGVVRLRV
jgi:hypothetical protein